MELYVNIGGERACLFVLMSNRLLDRLVEFPLLHSAVEESLISEKNGHYSIGIIVWYDLLKEVLNVNSKEDSDQRLIPAHYILRVRPTKKSYDDLLQKFKDEAKKQYLREVSKDGNQKIYLAKLSKKWEVFIKSRNV